jgi:hypothetical protein
MPTEVLPARIEIPGDTLVPDAVFCTEVLAGAHRRTAKRLEAKGLPFVMVAGRKYRPLNEGSAWLAKRIKRPNQIAPRPRRHLRGGANG